MQTDLTDFFAAQSDVRLAILFGSAAKDQLRPESDIDVAVQCDSPLSASRKSALIAGIALIAGRPVDVIDLHTAGQPLLGQILQGQRIKGQAQQIVPLALRNMMDRADFLPLIERTLAERRRAWMQA